MFHLFLQDSPNDCGAACLATILRHLGLYITPIDLARELEFTRAGTSSKEIGEMAARFGLHSKLIQLDISAFHRITSPCIAYVTSELQDWNHMVVIFRVAGKHIWIGDPGKGKRKMSMEAFSANYLGLLMIFQPDDSFRTGRFSEPYLFRFLKFVWEYKNKILLSLLMGVITSMEGFCLIYLSK